MSSQPAPLRQVFLLPFGSTPSADPPAPAGPPPAALPPPPPPPAPAAAAPAAAAPAAAAAAAPPPAAPPAPAAAPPAAADAAAAPPAAADAAPALLAAGGAVPSERVQEVVARLKFIAKLRPNEKLAVSTLTVQPVGWASSLARSFWGWLATPETRDRSLGFVKETIAAAAALMAAEPDVAPWLAAELSAARGGVASLAATYRDDRMFSSRVETLAAALDALCDAKPPAT